MDEEFMRAAIKEAETALIEGENTPFGAVIVKDNKIIAKSHNSPVKSIDPTAHAEINAIRKAAVELKTNNLTGCILYSTCEPCPMCFSAAWWARISKVVYGARISDIIKLGNRQINVSCEYLNKKGTFQLEIISGFLNDECKKLY